MPRQPGAIVTLRTQRIGVSTIFVVHGAVMGTFATRIPAIAEHLHLTPGTLGVALFAPAVGSITMMPFTGRIIHRLGGRLATHLLLGLWCAMLVLPALAPSLALLWLALFVFGASAGMSDIAMNAQAVALDEAMGKSIMSGLHGMWSVGGFAAAGVGALAAQADIGVRAHFAGVAIVLLVVGQFACRLLPATTDEHVTVPGETGAGDPATAPTAELPAAASADGTPPVSGDAPKSPRFGFPSRAVLVIGLVAFCAVFGEVAGSDWCAVYLRRVLGAGHATAALGYAVFAFAMAACRLTGDRFIRRFGAARAVRTGAIAGSIGAALVVAAVDTVLTIVGFGLIGLGVAVVVPLAFVAAGRLARAQTSAGGGTTTSGAKTGNAIAGVATIAYGAGLAAPGVIGGIASLTSLRVSFIVVTVLVVAVAVFAGVLGDPDRRGPRDTPTPTGAADPHLHAARAV